MDVTLLEKLVERGLIGDFRHYPTTGSTNSLALALAGDATIRCPLLISAAEQTAGRGRGANRWWSKSGCLMFSLVVDTSDWLSAASWPLLSLATGISIAQTLEQLLPGQLVGVKWPNDVYVGGRKIAGILIETTAQAPRRLVIGVGLNVNNSVTDAPAEIQSRSVAMVDVMPQPWSLPLVLSNLIERMNENWQMLAKSGFESFAAQWPRYCILTGCVVTVKSADKTITGRCQGIDATGCLVVETTSGTEHLTSGSIEQFSWPAG